MNCKSKRSFRKPTTLAAPSCHPEFPLGKGVHCHSSLLFPTVPGPDLSAVRMPNNFLFLTTDSSESLVSGGNMG